MVLDSIKKVKVYRNSRGNNKLLFNQIQRRRFKSVGPTIPVSEDEILRCLQKTAQCCSQGNHYLGCVGKKFSKDETTNICQLVSYVKECREFTRRKTPDEIKQFTKEIFEKANISESSELQRTKMDYRLKLLKSASHIDVTNNKVCRRGICAVYGISVKSIQAYSAAKKTGTVGSFLTKSSRYTDSTILKMTFKEVEDVFQSNLPEHTSLDDDMVRSAITPFQERACVIWLENHFEVYGDKAPNKHEIQLSVSIKKEVFEMYEEEQNKFGLESVKYNTFVNLWGTLFPNVKSRPWVDVPGKCSTCYIIDRLRKTAEEREVQRHVGLAHQMHRGGLFMLEREKYYKRIAYALNNKETVMSIIIDGMDQNHSRIPYLGNQAKFSQTLDQGITGVKEHGVGFTIYRTVGNVKKKTAEFTIYCILTQLESWHKRHRRFPEELIIQLDGGAENANKLVLSMLELIVTKRMVKIIHSTRLPTGHTHEDIDACFALIWASCRDKVSLTLKEYEDHILNHFKTTKIPTRIENVYVIPDYGKLLNDCVDTKLAKLHKWPYTQHCWRFEAVLPSSNFKFGCKTTYKAYSSDKVVELVNKPISQCYSAIGQYTGLEPITVYNTWQPIHNGLEGMYLLRKIPPAVESITSIQPQAFDDDGIKSINSCLSEIRRKFVGEVEKEALDWWNEWAQQHVSAFVSAEHYVKHQLDVNKLHFKNPLAGYLFGKEVPMATSWNSKLSEVTSNINPGFQWPDIIAAATSSVTTDFNHHPPEPRAIFFDQTELNGVLKIVNEKITAYYSSLSTTSKVGAIKVVMNQKVQPSGNILKTSNAKKEVLIERWKQNDNIFLNAIFSPLSPNKLDIVTPLCLFVPDDLYTPIICRQNKLFINRSALIEVNGSTVLGIAGMNSIVQLFCKRNDNIVSREVNSAFKPSLFMNSTIFTTIMNLDFSEPFNFASINDELENLDVNKIYRIYFPYQLSNESWSMVILDFNLSVIYFVDHKNHSDDPEFIQLMDKVEVQCNCLIAEFWNLNEMRLDEDWEVTLFPLNGSCCGEDLSGIFVATVMYFIVQECPVYISVDQLSNIKQKFALWLIEGSLPL